MQNSIDTPLRDLAAKVSEMKESLANERFLSDENNYTNHMNRVLRDWRENLITLFSKSILDDLEVTYENLKSWGLDGVKLLVNLDLPLDLAIEEVRFYRKTIGEIIKEEAVKNDFSIPFFYEVITRFDSVVDRAVYWLSLSYSTAYTARIQAAETTAMELSIPIVRVTEDIGVMPLVGDIDTKRSQELMDKALCAGTELGLKYIVIDLSGVPIIDTMVANHIFKAVDAIKLLGISAFLTGIRPEIAQTMVNLGINTNGITTFGSLHHAVKHIQNSMQLT